MRYAAIASVGHSVQGQVVTNREIEGRIGLDEGWIERRTGVKTRHFLNKGVGVSAIALEAASNCLSGLADELIDQIGLVILATSTPDHLLPPTSPLICDKLNLKDCGAFDLTGACSGFLYGISLADAYVRANEVAVLVIGANVLSTRIDPYDPATAGLFSDAAGAVLVVPSKISTKCGQILSTSIGHKGALYKEIIIPSGGSANPFDESNVDERYITIPDGRRVFQAAVASLVEQSRRAIDKAGRSIEELQYWIPHQANIRIIQKAADILGLEPSQCIFTIEKYGNSSAATIPLSLSTEWPRISDGGLCVCASVGAGVLDAAVALEF